MNTLQSENQRLTEQYEALKESWKKGAELYAHLRFDDQEFTPYQIAVQKVERLTKINEEMVNFIQGRIKDSFNAIESGGSEFYPFDGHTIESLEGMKRAYSDVLSEIKRSEPEDDFDPAVKMKPISEYEIKVASIKKVEPVIGSNGNSKH